MRKRFAFPVAILGLLIPAGVMLTMAPQPRVRAYDPPPVERYLYAAYPFSDEAKLVLANSTMREVTIQGKLFSPSGKVAFLDDVILPAHAQKTIDLDAQIALEVPEFKSAGIELEFHSADPGIAGQLLLRNDSRQQAIDVPLKGGAAYLTSRLEGMWFLPAQDAQIGAILYNWDEVETTATVAITRQDGTVLRSRSVTLGPHQSRPFEVQDLIRNVPGAVGGISTHGNTRHDHGRGIRPVCIAPHDNEYSLCGARDSLWK